MVDTIKFSEMTDGGDIDNNKKVPGLKNGGNVLFNNPWTFLPSGTTAERPTPSAEVNFRLRFNTTDQLYEYYDTVLGQWTQLQESAFTQGPFITYESDPSLPDAQNLGALANGILKQTIASGSATVDIAIQGTDYYAPGDNATFSGITMTGSIDMAGFDIDNLPTPTLSSQAATKGYVDSIVSNVHPACYVTTTANLAGYIYNNGASGVGATLTAGSNGAFSADGVSPPLDARILVPFQTAQAENGIYTLTQVGDGSNPAILTRADDYDQSSEMQAGDTVAVVNGTTYATTTWMMTQTATIVIGTTAITWAQQSSPTGALLAVNNLSDVDDVSTSRTNLGLGSIATQDSNAVNITGGTIDGTVIGGVTPAAGDFTDVYATGSYRAGVVDSNQIVVGGATFDACYAAKTNNTGNLFCFLSNRAASSATLPAALMLAKARGTHGSETIVQNGDLIGGVYFAGFDGTDYALGAQISASVSSTPGNNDMPCVLDLSASPDGAQVPLLCFRNISVASAVNYVAVQNNATGGGPFIDAQGTDTNIILNLRGKGTGGVQILGTSTNNDASTGYVGEIFSSVVLAAGAVAISPSGTTVNVTSITLTPGDWDIYGSAVTANSGTATTFGFMGISTTSATLPDGAYQTQIGGSATAGTTFGGAVSPRRFTISSNTTYYLVCRAGFSGGTQSVFGNIYARRAR